MGGKNKKKVSRKELLKKPDEFIQLSTKLINFAKEHSKLLIYCFVSVIGLCLVISVMLYFSNMAETRAFALLDQAMLEYHEKEKIKGTQASYEEVKDVFVHILEQYSGKDGGEIAGLAFANISYQAGDYEKAVELYLKSLEYFKEAPFYKNLILTGLGYSYLAKKDFNAAKSYFEMASEFKDAPMREDTLFNLGMLYLKSGENAKTEETFRKISTDHPNSPFVELVKE